MAKGEQAGEADQELEPDGSDHVDQNQIQDEIVVFVGTHAEQRACEDQGGQKKENHKPRSHKPGAENPLVFFIAEHRCRRKIVIVDL
jgi:hypothetical protein